MPAKAGTYQKPNGSLRRHNRSSPTPQPIEVGKEYEVDITETRRQGDGTIVDPLLIK